MHVFDISEDTTVYHRMLIAAIEDVTDRNANVFSMRVQLHSRVFEFITTSKDVFLFLGRLDDDGRKIVAEALDTELKRTDTNQLLWQYRRKEANPDLCTRKSMVVIRTGNDDLTFLTFSPA